MRRLRAAVVGAGHAGRQHARIYAGMAAGAGAAGAVELAAVVDPDLARARDLAERHGARALESCAQLDAEIDLASVAVPTSRHREVAAPLIERGIAVLVEKPLAASVEDGRALAALARARGVCLQVGHVERFNPVLRAARRFALEPRFVEAHRLAPFSFRSADVGVVHDLMIHDLDLVLQLVRAPLAEVRATGGALLSAHEDIASARLEFAGGAVANLTASRVSLTPLRRMRFFARDAFLSLDFGSRRAFLARRPGDFDARLAANWERFASTPDAELPAFAAAAFRELIDVEEVALDDEEPLQAELASFVRAVRTGAAPEVPADEALRALEAAAAVLDRIRSRPW